MTRAVATTFCLLFCSFIPVDGQDENADPPVRVELIDGSRIIGQLERNTVEAQTKYGSMNIPLHSVHQFSRLDDGQVRIDFANGDEMTVQPKFKQLNCSTLFGNVQLQMKHVRRLHVESQAFQSLVANRNVVVYYGFDSSEDERISNQAMDAMHGTNLGGRWTKDGVNGGCIEFDGSSRIEIPHDNRLCPKTFTFAAWVYPTENSSNYETIMSKTSSSWSGGYGICRMSGDHSNVRFFVNGYTSKYVSQRLPIRKWTHLACVVHGEGIRFYINGKAQAEADRAHNNRHPLASRVQHTTTPLMLGGDPSHYGWKGKLDEFVLFNTALSEKQIGQLSSRFRPRDDYSGEDSGGLDSKRRDSGGGDFGGDEAEPEDAHERGPTEFDGVREAGPE